MAINNALRKRLKILLPKNYRQTVVARLLERGIKVHSNTVYNVLHGSENPDVMLEIIKLCNEEKSLNKEIAENLKQLSEA